MVGWVTTNLKGISKMREMIFHKIEDWCFRWIASSAKSSLNLCPHQHHQLLKKILVNGFENKNISKHWTPPQVWPNLVSLKVTRICAMHLQQTMARVMIDMNRNKTIFFWEMQLAATIVLFSWWTAKQIVEWRTCRLPDLSHSQNKK